MLNLADVPFSPSTDLLVVLIVHTLIHISIGNDLNDDIYDNDGKLSRANP